MANPNLATIVADAWETELRESPTPFGGEFLLEAIGGPRRTYRERLDAQPRNYFGELIPRIVTVRRNLRRLKAGY